MNPEVREMEDDVWASTFFSFRLDKKKRSDEGKGDQYTVKRSLICLQFETKNTHVRSLKCMLQNKARFYGAKWCAGSHYKMDSVKCGEYKIK